MGSGTRYFIKGEEVHPDHLTPIEGLLLAWSLFPESPKVLWSGKSGEEPWALIPETLRYAHAGLPQYERVITFFSKVPTRGEHG